RSPARLVAVIEVLEEALLLLGRADGIDRRSAEPRVRYREIEACVAPRQLFDLHGREQRALARLLVLTVAFWAVGADRRRVFVGLRRHPHRVEEIQGLGVLLLV